MLVLLNLVTFEEHYFRDVGFPWDFVQSYYAMGAFAVSALSSGELPEWMPYQCMGYPFLLNPQAGFFYPPLWVFAALGLDYTLHAAVVLQCLHVLFGAAGAFFLLRRLAGSPQLALVGAAAYHFFGGFYGNSQHVDIIRAFAVTPWLFHGLTFAEGRPPRVGSATLLLPLWTYLLATGGYPGNLIASMLAGLLYLGLQVVAGQQGQGSLRGALRAGAATGALLGMGLAMAAAHLLPIWLQSGLFHRAGAVGALRYADLWQVGFGTVLVSTSALKGMDPSMTSTFITVPVVMAALLATGRQIGARWPFVAMLVYAVLMSGGPRSLVWRVVAEAIPPVRLSRFPTSDYRPLVALGVIALATVGVRAALARGHTRQGLLARLAIGLLVVAQLVLVAHGSLTHEQVLWASIVAVLTLGVLLVLRRIDGSLGWLGALALVTLIGADARRVLPDMETWRMPDVSRLYEERRWTTESPRDLARVDGLDPLRGPRPAREEVGHRHWFSWAGYLQRRFMLDDRTPCLLETAHEAQRRGNYALYMRREWAPLLVRREELDWEGGEARIAPHSLAAVGAPPPGQIVTQVSHGLDRIRYRARLTQPVVMIENEMHFAGWTATLENRSRRKEIAAFPVNGVFRAWSLPPGTYEMTARFRMPHLRLAGAVSLAGAACWILAVVFWRRAKASGLAVAASNGS